MKRTTIFLAVVMAVMMFGGTASAAVPAPAGGETPFEVFIDRISSAPDSSSSASGSSALANSPHSDD